MIVSYLVWWVIRRARFWEILLQSPISSMISFSFSVLDFLTFCLLWGVWLQYNTDAHQGMG